MMDRQIATERFLALSAHLTGHDAARLTATGMADIYLDTMTERAGARTAEALLDAHADQVAAAEDPDRALRLAILGDARLGPVARRLIKMWYVGTWYALPADWRAAHGPDLPEGDTIPVPAAYTEGLLWPSVGANPPGAKPFGYAMWAKPPRVTLDSPLT
jgi:hypothetical protein